MGPFVLISKEQILPRLTERLVRRPGEVLNFLTNLEEVYAELVKELYPSQSGEGQSIGPAAFALPDGGFSIEADPRAWPPSLAEQLAALHQEQSAPFLPADPLGSVHVIEINHPGPNVPIETVDPAAGWWEKS